MKVQEFLWHALGDYVQRTDVNQDLDPEGENRGFQQRYCEGIGEWVDENLLYFIDNLLVVTRYAPLPTVVPLLERHLGLETPLYEDMSLRTKLVRYLKRCNRNKGSLRNYRFLLGLLDFDVEIEETYPSGQWDKNKWDTKKWDQNKSINATYHLTLTKRFNFPTTPLLEAQIQRIIQYNNPIYVLAPTYSIISYEPIISISPSSLSFPQTILGNTSTLSFTVSNTGNATLELTSIDLPTQFTSDFAPVVLEPSEDVTFQLTFEPINAGSFSVEVTLNSNAFVGNHTIEVFAPSVAATRIINISPTSLAYGTVQVGSTATRTFNISNTGNSPLTISSINLPAGGYTADWTSGTIAAGASRTITVTFAPTTNGAQDGTINVSSNATSGSDTISVTAVVFLQLMSAFDGGLNEMRTATTALNFSHTSAYTISVYFRTPNATLLNTTYLFAGSHSDIDNNIYFGIESKGFVFGRTRNGVAQKVRGTTILSPDTLYKVDFVSEGAGASNLKIYVNNALHGTNITANGTITDGAPSTIFYVGALGNLGLRYAGLLGYIRGYSKVLTSTERTTQYNSFLPLDIAELVTAWEFQDAKNSPIRLDSTAGAKTLTLFGYSPLQQNEAQRTESNAII